MMNLKMIFLTGKKRNDIIAKSIIFIILMLLSFLVVMQSPLSMWKHGETGTDSSVFKYVAFALSEGKMPYRDTFDHKGPLIYILNYIGLMISYWRGIWLIEWINCFITFAAIYKIARLRCSRIMSGIVLVIATAPLFTYFHGGNLTEEYALPFIAVSLYYFLDFFINGQVTRLRLIIIGISFAAVCLLRPNMISVWVVFCISIFISCLYQKQWKELRQFILFFVLGAVLLAGPVLLWLVVNHAFVDFVEAYFQFNMLYSSPAQWESAGSGGSRCNAFIAFFNESRMLYAFVILLYLVLKRRDKLNISYMFYFLITLFFISISGMTTIHYAMILVPVIAWPLTEMLYMAEQAYRKNNAIALFIPIYFMVTFALPVWINATNYVVQVYNERESSEFSWQVQEIAWVIEQNTEENDSITVCGNWDIIYNVTQRLSASKYSYQLPIGNVDSEIMDEYFEELSVNNPRIVVVTQNAKNESTMEKRINQYLTDNNYQLIWSESEDGSGTQLYLLPEMY